MSHKIGITACSNPMHPSFSADLARLCQILRKLGFDPVLSPCLFDNGSGFSGTECGNRCAASGCEAGWRPAGRQGVLFRPDLLRNRESREL